MDGMIHIAIFSGYLILKNVINQLAVACLLWDGYIIHLIYFSDKDASYISDFCYKLILIHSNMKKINHFDLNLLLLSLNINL